MTNQGIYEVEFHQLVEQHARDFSKELLNNFEKLLSEYQNDLILTQAEKSKSITAVRVLCPFVFVPSPIKEHNREMVNNAYQELLSIFAKLLKQIDSDLNNKLLQLLGEKYEPKQ